jgi:hypothetical protein
MKVQAVTWFADPAKVVCSLEFPDQNKRIISYTKYTVLMQPEIFSLFLFYHDMFRPHWAIIRWMLSTRKERNTVRKTTS